MEAVKSIKINTLHPARKTGVVMHEKIYAMVSEYILQAVYEEKELTLTNLLEKAELNFSDPLEGNLAWHFLHVKLDLEARGLLQVKVLDNDSRHGMHVLRLTRQGLARFRERIII
jgi:hypothetical protein